MFAVFLQYFCNMFAIAFAIFLQYCNIDDDLFDTDGTSGRQPRALGSIGASKPLAAVADFYTIFLQYFYNIFAIFLQYFYNMFSIFLQYFCNIFAIFLQYVCDSVCDIFAILQY